METVITNTKLIGRWEIDKENLIKKNKCLI